MDSAGIPSPLVGADWLRAQIGSPGLVVLDARIGSVTRDDGRTAYVSGRAGFEAEGHIPGALFADLCNGFSDPDGAFAFTRPRPDAFRRVVRELGISPQSRVIVYDNLTGAWAARVWWVLRAYGHQHVQVLDGGFCQWKAAGGDVAFGPSPAVQVGDFDPVARKGYFVDLPDILAYGADLPLVCALREDAFSAGHIPGSISIPYRHLIGDDGRLNLALARKRLQEAGFSPISPAVFYCGGGINAAGLALAAVSAGFTAPRIFDGSLTEWMADPARPLEKGMARA